MDIALHKHISHHKVEPKKGQWKIKEYQAMSLAVTRRSLHPMLRQLFVVQESYYQEQFYTNQSHIQSWVTRVSEHRPLEAD
ncbi:hypothetical protein M404DRAFT_995903 [Pisolithus tinctorius Marx 270]|uniref:Uncharacterized protein n=1 Tax=Pisolithus tinctorius Marx 270 TaxID=870435 RepID=A0A0C3JLA9_PISTI|nr:hypothetical protein M404DRAFT_995903 [Pisolithus tinctorius Marx 270]